MRPNHQRRQRGRNGKPNKFPNRNQSYDSNGPDVRVRGTAHQIFEKYQALARESMTSGDRVMAESYYQHAEHYYRIIQAQGGFIPPRYPQPWEDGEPGDESMQGGDGMPPEPGMSGRDGVDPADVPQPAIDYVQRGGGGGYASHDDYNAGREGNYNNGDDRYRGRDDGRGRDDNRARDDNRGRDENRARDDNRGRDENRARDDNRGRDENRARDDNRGRDENRARDDNRGRDDGRGRDDRSGAEGRAYEPRRQERREEDVAAGPRGRRDFVTRAEQRYQERQDRFERPPVVADGPPVVAPPDPVPVVAEAPVEMAAELPPVAVAVEAATPDGAAADGRNPRDGRPFRPRHPHFRRFRGGPRGQGVDPAQQDQPDLTGGTTGNSGSSTT